MSEETTDQELDAEMQQLIEQEAAQKAAAPAIPEPQPEPSPEPAPDAQVQTPPDEPEPANTPNSSAPVAQAPVQDDLAEWKRQKGFKSEEDMIRSLRNMEQEFHKRNQQGHPGYRDVNGAPPPPPPPPNWNPAPQGYQPNGYGYQAPPPPPPPDITRQLSHEFNMDPEDVERLMPLVVRVSSAISAQERARLNAEMADLRQSTARNNELLSLSQDPAFSDARVQKEMHDILKDGSLFQRERAPYQVAFTMALSNLARKQLQQGNTPERGPSNNPPVTAGGGNGSARANFTVTPQMFDSWTMKEQDAYIKSNGRVLPKR